MKKICIALDYNPTSEKVAKIGYAYAKALNAQVVLAHVITDPSFYGIEYSPFLGYDTSFGMGSMEGSMKLENEIEKGAENFLSTAAQHLGSRDIGTVVLNGDTADAILDYTAENKIDLLVIGTHSHSAFENMMVGNTAIKVLKHAKVPLLIVPTKK